MKYVLERKDTNNEYFEEIDYGYQMNTFCLNNAKVFYSKEDAEKFNNDYLFNEYYVKEIV